MTPTGNDGARLRELDSDIKRGQWAVQMSPEQLKAKASSGSWVAGVLAILLVTSLMLLGLIREYAYYRVYDRTCDAVLRNSALDKDKLDFLAKNCVTK
jgi:hypothetical protein